MLVRRHHGHGSYHHHTKMVRDPPRRFPPSLPPSPTTVASGAEQCGTRICARHGMSRHYSFIQRAHTTPPANSNSKRSIRFRGRWSGAITSVTHAISFFSFSNRVVSSSSPRYATQPTGVGQLIEPPGRCDVPSRWPSLFTFFDRCGSRAFYSPCR